MAQTSPAAIADILLSIGAVALNPSQPFTWASGLRSPIYCDNRLTISFPEIREQIESAFVQLIEQNFPDVDVIGGTATAGIPHAAIIAHKMNLPMIYVRSSAKDHGKQNQIEGLLKAGQKVVMIEDLISTGGSVIQAAEAVKAAGGEVMGIAAIFTYSLASSKENFAKQDYDLVTLTDYPTLVEQAIQHPELADYRDTLREWYKNPKQWSENFLATHKI